MNFDFHPSTCRLGFPGIHVENIQPLPSVTEDEQSKRRLRGNKNFTEPEVKYCSATVLQLHGKAELDKASPV